jgi:hypothetical protein
MTRTARMAILLWAACMFAGCHAFDQGIPSEQRQADAAKAPKTALSTDSSFIVEHRYLFLPITLDDDGKDKLYGASAMVVGSAWSGFGSGGYSRQWVNIEVVDLSSGKHCRVFERLVALDTWDLSLPSREESQGPGLRFPGLLFLRARTEDANGDGQLNWKDPVWVFVYDLNRQELRRISPDDYNVVRCIWNEQTLIINARRMGSDELAVYAYEPQTGQGRFIVQGLRP